MMTPTDAAKAELSISRQGNSGAITILLEMRSDTALNIITVECEPAAFADALTGLAARPVLLRAKQVDG